MGSYAGLPSWDRTRFDALVQVAKQHFGPITPAEFQVLAHSACGGDLPNPTAAMPRPEVRQDFLRWLATDPDATPLIDGKGIRVWSATIPGRLDLQGCVIPHHLTFIGCDLRNGLWIPTLDIRGLYFFGGETAGGIHADGIHVHGPLFFRRHVTNGPVSLIGAVIGGNADFSGSKMRAEPIALVLDGATIQGSLFFKTFESSIVECSGEIRMLNAHVRGDFGFLGSKLASNEKALSLDKVIVEGNMAFIEGFNATGSVNIPGAQIRGDLDFNGASIEAKGIAVSLASSRIRGHVYLRNGFTSSGEIFLHGVEIGRSLDLGGAILKSASVAICLEKGTVQGNIYLCEGFQSDGRIDLQGSKVSGDLTCSDAVIPALYCLNMELDGDLIWSGIRDSKKTILCLNGAQIGTLRDERESWPGRNGLRVDGLTYGELTLHDARLPQEIEKRSMGREHELRASDRIDWLRLQPSTDLSEPQPWMQLANLLIAKGDGGGAKRVIFELRRIQAKKSFMCFRWLKLFHALLEMQPLLILASIAFFTLFGSLEFWLANKAHAMAPTEIAAYSEWRRGVAIDTGCPPFNPAIYSLENGLPLMRLGQDDKWAPDPKNGLKIWHLSYPFLAWSRWILILAGWAQATILASAIGSKFKS
jgi:hypothetical protein